MYSDESCVCIFIYIYVTSLTDFFVNFLAEERSDVEMFHRDVSKWRLITVLTYLLNTSRYMRVFVQ